MALHHDTRPFATLPIWCVHCKRQVFKLIAELIAHGTPACPLCGGMTKATPDFLAVIRQQ
jgi:hypothetical protein